MPDRQFTDADQAALYDRLAPPHERDDFRFYLPMILASDAVLDVGCGTGALLHMARDAGHAGRLVGLDPAEGMLAQARRRHDIEWILGDLSTAHLAGEFDLAVMTGNTFQVLLTDDEVRDALASVRSALADGGRFAFETRNPAARAWERWTPGHGVDFTDADGNPVRWESEVERPIRGGLVRFRSTYSSPRWDRPRESVSTLRFMERATLNRLLTDAGFTVEAQYGDYDRSPLNEASPEIFTVARKRSREGCDRSSARCRRGTPGMTS